MNSPISPLSTASQPKSKFLAISGLTLMLAGGVSSAALVQITNLPVTLGVPSQGSSAPIVTGTIPIDAVATDYTLTITATATFESITVAFQAAEVGQTNGGLVVNNPGHVNRFSNNATIYFDMVIKDAGDVDVTALYDITITNLYAFVDAGQDVLKINVDSGAAVYSFPKAAGTGNAAIWAQGTIPQYKIPDPSNVSFLSVGNDGAARRFNFNGIEMDITPIPEPGSLALLGLSGLALILRRRR